FFSSRRRHTRSDRDWSSDVCSSDLDLAAERALERKIAQFDRGKIFGEPGLEGAVVVTDTQSGEVQALVGGRDVRFRGFNRALDRSEERRVGKECRCRWSAYPYKKKE